MGASPHVVGLPPPPAGPAAAGASRPGAVPHLLPAAPQAAGFLVIEDFASPEEVRQLKERGEELVSRG